MRLRYTPEAAYELDRILRDISELSPQGASRIRSSIQRAADLLRECPYSGQRTSRRNLRRLVSTPYPYLIFYRVEDDEVIIVGIRHAARKPSSMPGQT